jgi:amidase
VPTVPSDFLWDTLQVTGCMARTAEDVGLMLQAVSGPDPSWPLSQVVAGRDFAGAVGGGAEEKLRLAYCPDIAGIGIEPEIEHACRTAAFELAQMGAQVEEIELDLSGARQAFLALRGYWMVAQQFARLENVDSFGPNVRGNIHAGLATTTRELGEAEHERGRLWDTFRQFFQRFDRLLTPCMAVPPFPVEQNYPEKVAGRVMETYVDWIAPTFLLSLTGLPVASVPCGLDGAGLPIGVQIVGPPRGEEAVLALAGLVQQARPIGLPAAL